ncbi:DUF1707 SHOCT-like domain-containing protein [Hoyosella subflava]|uniref:Uncharacterized protein n=1 Tax=Hoyosella subflava (strain DSM 45089 / JCM 17490 / NBRC 109087 / DQS3-9A1) TaxID=443218 RepID=F6EI42_HOYSD|nr:DUF1707 domain-containing protein [Hoyosella subflava]AEF39991.1 hypothetical protein AS9A_1540 [Hoyosella subflava DQS3-9A1]
MTQPDRRNLRASDKDREVAVKILNQAHSEGRITLSELDERLGAAYSAVTYTDLDVVVADLPVPALPGAAPAPSAGQPLRLNAGFSDLKRDGYWKVPNHIVASTAMGSLKLDFTQAEFPYGQVLIEASAGMGNIVLIVPAGVTVSTDEVKTTMGSVKNKLGYTASPADATIRVTGSAGMGNVVARPPRKWRFMR